MKPTPDYVMLGPGPDVPANGQDPIQRFDRRPPSRGIVLVVVIGALAGLVVATSRGSAWIDFANEFSTKATAPTSPKDTRQLDRMKPQAQAETLLEMAVAHSDGAVDQISARVDRWHGRLQWSPQIASLSTAALNSNDMRVRESGVEVELAAYGLGKNTASFDYVRKQVESPDHSQKIWALWALGLLANRGVESDQAADVLIRHLSDEDIESRQWAVEGLALAGTDASLDPLMRTIHDDASAVVRERAACSLAESGMFTPEQRWTVVPQLISYTDDPMLDAQTRGWAFQALGDITHQRLPSDPAAWRAWYAGRSGG
jgi:hypothetical protein